jgi:hypothetical protein
VRHLSHTGPGSGTSGQIKLKEALFLINAFKHKSVNCHRNSPCEVDGGRVTLRTLTSGLPTAMSSLTQNWGDAYTQASELIPHDKINRVNQRIKEIQLGLKVTSEISYHFSFGDIFSLL